MGVFRYYWLDFAFTCVGLLFLLLDIGLDAWAVVDLYQEGAHVCLGLLLLFLLGSSALVQAFSWLWYGYDSFKRHTWVEQLPSRTQLGLLHLLQLGIYFRYVLGGARFHSSSCADSTHHGWRVNARSRPLKAPPGSRGAMGEKKVVLKAENPTV